MTRARASEELYETAPCGLLRMSPGGTIERANQTFCGLVGFSAAELEGHKRFQDLLTVGSKIFHQTHWLPLLQLQGSVAEVQFEFQHREGSVVAALVNARVARADAPLPQPLGDSVDIAVFVATDRRKYERELLLARRKAEELFVQLSEREAQFRTLAENSPDVIVRFDRSFRYVYMNRVRLGDGSIDRFLGKQIGEVGFAPSTVRAWERALESAFEGEDVTLAFAHDAADGTHYELQARVVPERDVNGKIVTVMLITRDVSALRAQELEASQRALLAEQLVGIVSHDLRNPLNAVLLGTQLLQSSTQDPLHARTVARISSAGERANRLVGDLLDFTQARLGGGLRVERQDLELHAVVAQCLDEIRLANPRRMLEHRAEGSGSGRADADRIAQIVSNLVNNALTYGTAELAVTITSVVRGASLEIHVHNLGSAIAPEVQAHIFEPLRRGEHSVKLGSRSVGLGLYIVHEIARAHGGRVSLSSSETEGTTFSVVMPRD